MQFDQVPEEPKYWILAKPDRDSLVLAFRAHKFHNPRNVNLYFTIMEGPCQMITREPNRVMLAKSRRMAANYTEEIKPEIIEIIQQYVDRVQVARLEKWVDFKLVKTNKLAQTCIFGLYNILRTEHFGDRFNVRFGTCWY